MIILLDAAVDTQQHVQPLRCDKERGHMATREIKMQRGKQILMRTIILRVNIHICLFQLSSVYLRHLCVCVCVCVCVCAESGGAGQHAV